MHETVGWEPKLNEGRGMKTKQGCHSKTYIPGRHLTNSAHFAPMQVTLRNSTNSNPEEVKKVRLVHGSILSVIEANMGRIYLDRRRSSDRRAQITAAGKDGQPMCSNTSETQHYLNDWRSLRREGDVPSGPILAPLRREVDVPSGSILATVSEKTELAHQHGLHVTSSDLGKKGEGSQHSDISKDCSPRVEVHLPSEVGVLMLGDALEESGPVHAIPSAASIGSVSHDQGL